MKKIAMLAVAFGVAFAASTVSAVTMADLGGSTVFRATTKAAGVLQLQTALNACGANPQLATDGVYGPKTAAAIMAVQAKNGLKVDGVAGPETKGYAISCTPGTGTGTGNGTGTGTALTGGAGDLTATQTTTDVKSTVKEDSDENVLGLKLEADGSDISVTSLKVAFQNNSGNGSTRLNKYVDEVVVMLGTKEVGSMSADDFTKDGTVYTKSIPLSAAVIKENKDAKLYVNVKTLSTVDDVTADFDVSFLSLRYEDAEGAIMSLYGDDNGTTTDLTDDSVVENFDFDDANADDDISLKSSSADPDAATIKVDANTNSDEALVFAYKLSVDDNSSDITINELPIDLTFNDSANTGTTDSADGIVDEVRVKIGSDEFTAELDTDGVTNGDGTSTYLVDTNGDVTINAGDDAEVKVYVTFKDQDGNYGSGTTVFASTTGADIDAEGIDEVTVTGTQTGETHTLALEGLQIAVKSQSVSYLLVGQNTQAEFKIALNVSNFGEDDIYLPFNAIEQAGLTPTTDEEGLSYLIKKADGTTYTGGTPSASVEAEDANIEETDSFLIESDSTEVITLTVTLDNDGQTAGNYRLVITDATYVTTDADGTDASAAGVAQDYTDLRTSLKYLGNATI